MTHSGDSEYKEKAKSKCKDIVFWLYLVVIDSNTIEAVPSMACNSERLADALKSAAQKCLSTRKEVEESISSQVEKSLKRPVEVLAESSSSSSELMEKIVQIQNSNVDKSAKLFKQIPSKYQNIILVVSSMGEATELEYNGEAAEVFKCSNTLHAQVMLNSLLETEGIGVSISPAVTTTLLYGSFLWKNSFSPSGFAASVLTSESIFCSDTLHEGIILDYSTKFDMSNASLSKLTKSLVLYPTEFEEMIQRLKAIYALSVFFFKRNSYLSQGLRRVVKFCEENKMLLHSRIYTDKKFIAKFICTVDERIYLWLKECSSKDIVLETNLTLEEFSSLLQLIN